MPPKTAAIARHSARIEKTESTRVVDEATRVRRLKARLEALDQDNAHEDPHANIVWHKAIPKFDDNVMIATAGAGAQRGRKREIAIASDEPPKKKKKLRTEFTKQRFKKSFAMMVEEESQTNRDDPFLRDAYVNAAAAPSRYPPKRYCTSEMTLDEKPVVEKITDAGHKASNVFADWWRLTTAEKRPKADPKNMVSVKDLPLYSEDHPSTQYHFQPEEPLPLQREFSTVREAFNNEYDRVVSRFSFVDKVTKKTCNAATKINSYVQEEWTVLPKAGAITVGGMAGFVLGLKKGGFGRLLTTTTGFLSMAAFCYPNETIDILRTGVAHTEQKWHEFQQSPEPVQKKVDLSPPK